MEGHRHKDIIRWRIADNVLNGWCHGLKTNDVVGTDDGYVRVENRTFNANKHYLWPIPQAERDLNGNLEQNDSKRNDYEKDIMDMFSTSGNGFMSGRL